MFVLPFQGIFINLSHLWTEVVSYYYMQANLITQMDKYTRLFHHTQTYMDTLSCRQIVKIFFFSAILLQIIILLLEYVELVKYIKYSI